MSDDRYAPFEIDEVIVKHTTEKALKVEVDDEEYWIPRSQLLDGTDIEYVDDVGTLVIPMWLAREKGLTE